MTQRTSHSGIEAASGLLRHMLASNAAKQLADERTSPRRYFDRLLERGLQTDALQVLPHLMPKPVAVWWGCMAVWEAYRPQPPKDVNEVLEGTVRWLHTRSEDDRRALVGPMKAAGRGTAAGCLGAAACYSEGSMSRPGLPVVVPPPHLTARFITATLMLAAVREPRTRVQRQRDLLGLGLAIARKEVLCPWMTSVDHAVAEAAASTSSRSE